MHGPCYDFLSELSLPGSMFLVYGVVHTSSATWEGTEYKGRLVLALLCRDGVRYPQRRKCNPSHLQAPAPLNVLMEIPGTDNWYRVAALADVPVDFAQRLQRRQHLSQFSSVLPSLRRRNVSRPQDNFVFHYHFQTLGIPGLTLRSEKYTISRLYNYTLCLGLPAPPSGADLPYQQYAHAFYLSFFVWAWTCIHEE